MKKVPCGRIHIGLRLLVSIWFQVLFTPLSGYFSPFPHGTGTLSVAREYLALARGRADFPRDSTCLEVLSNAAKSLNCFAYRTITFFGSAFQRIRLRFRFVTFWRVCKLPAPRAMTPVIQRLQAVAHYGFRLFPFRSPLLRKSLLIYFPRGTEMFHFPRLTSRAYVFSSRLPHFMGHGCPIRRSPYQRSQTTPRSLSQFTTSFFVFWRLGIHHTPLVA